MRSSTSFLVLAGVVILCCPVHEALAWPPFGIPSIPGGGAVRSAIRGDIPGVAQQYLPGNLVRGRLGSIINSVAGQSVANYVRPELMNSGYVAPHYLYGVGNGSNMASVVNQKSIRGYSYSQLTGRPAPGTPAPTVPPSTDPIAPPSPDNVNPQAQTNPSTEPGSAPPSTAPTVASTGPTLGAGAPSPGATTNGRLTEDAQGALDFAAKGEAEFRVGNYRAATRMWRHALLDSPQNGVLLLLVSQGQFAQGQYAQAALSVYDAIETLPEEHWGIVAGNYKTLYGQSQHYNDQLKALEKKVSESPDDPVLRFLVGYHYGCIGYPKNAVQEIDKVLPLIPEDKLTLKYRNAMAAKAGLPAFEAPKLSQR